MFDLLGERPANGRRVFILPIEENGTISSQRDDDAGEPIYTVIRDSDKKLHACRRFEIVAERVLAQPLNAASYAERHDRWTKNG